MEHMAGTSYKVYEGMLPGEDEIQAARENGTTLIVNRFHKWVNKKLREEKNPEE